MRNDFVYDIETYKNVFTMAVEHAESPLQWMFEISPWRNDSKEIIAFIHYIKSVNGRMVGFNNLGFDYPVIHTLIQMGNATAQSLYQKTMAIIESQNEDRFRHMVYPSDRHVAQLDLFKIHHFDNVARATSLKILEFNMRMDNIEDLPFPVGTELNQYQTEILKKYNKHDVKATKLFYHETIPMIEFREELTHKYQRDFMNHNDTKIGKDYFQMKLEEAGVQLYSYGPGGRKPVQTPRPVIKLNDCILPWVQFERPELQEVLNWLRSQEITETKGVFKGLTATVDGFGFDFGTGGIHGSVENKVYDATENMMIIDADVASMYPNIAIKNGFYPEHLGETFCSIYQHLYEQRKSHAKGTVENAMLKLALNGVYGDSNSRFSVFYDPQFTMSITLNGQLQLCLLAEKVMNIPGLEMIQANTDGISVYLPRIFEQEFMKICAEWEQLTKLELEYANYSRMFIRDVNNYIAEYEGGGVKRKGVYEYKLGWHQNASALVVPMVAEKALLEGVNIRHTLESHENKMDFMLRTKVPRSSKLVLNEYDPSIEDDRGTDVTVLQNVTRYYVAHVDNQRLIKLMPPTLKMKNEGNTNWRRIGIESGWGVQVCNNIEEQDLPINYDYYEQAVEKLVLKLC